MLSHDFKKKCSMHFDVAYLFGQIQEVCGKNKQNPQFLGFFKFIFYKVELFKKGQTKKVSMNLLQNLNIHLLRGNRLI